jgi:hypothetical protein
MLAAMLALFVARSGGGTLELADQAGDIRVTFKHYNLPSRRYAVGDDDHADVLHLYAINLPLLAGTNLALLTVPFVLYAMFRYLY